MRGESSTDVLKVWLYAASTVVLGAWMSPLVYNAGKAIDEVASVKQTNAVFKWLATLCDKADFPVFFETAMVAAALILFIPFFDWIRGGRFSTAGKIRSLTRPSAEAGGLRKNPRGFRQAAIGFGVVAGLLLLAGGILVPCGVLAWETPPHGVRNLLIGGLAVALISGTVQEILFRGIATGIFLKAMKPVAAMVLSSLLFAGAHLLDPAAGMNVANPELPGVGFELLGKIAGQFLQPRAVLCGFAPLVILGGLLAYARWRTESLFLPIGLHVGWIFASGVLAGATAVTRHTNAAAWLISPSSPRQGLIPLAALLAAGYFTLRLTSSRDAPETTS